MSWREERDALIAQTLAFVQSVTGKPADFAQLGPPAGERFSFESATPEHSADEIDAASDEAMRAEAAMIDAAMLLVSSNRRAIPGVTATNASRPATSPSPAGAVASAQAAVSDQPNRQADEFTGEHFTSITSELGLQRDMQSEIRARVATFRAHQERFNRERQEYFSSTLAKLRASMTDPDSTKNG
jgi:hypothetical protein